MASKILNNIYIKDYYSLAGPVEKSGPLTYDLVLDDYYFHEKTFESAEVKMQRTTTESILRRNNLEDKQVSLLVAGDLSNQISVSCYAARYFNIPFLGIYSACASFPESLIVSSMFLESTKNKYAISTISSHNLHAEKQFRYPIEYGVPRPVTQTFTATGSISSLITNVKSPIRIESYTIGKAIDLNIKDASHMGAVMAPAAADTLMKHLSELNRTIDYYDVVITGDLGCIGSKIFKEYIKRAYNIKLNKYFDAGCELYLKSQKDTLSGASGPVALPLFLFNKIIKEKKYKNILLLGTGSLHNPFFVNQKKSIPAISHAISLEVNHELH